MDEEARRREQDFLEYEIREIQEAELKEGEEEELSALYRRFSHSQRIAESLSGAKEGLDQEWLSRIAGLVDQAWNYDRGLEGIRSQVYDAQSILQDAAREIEAYLEDLDLDQGRFREIEERLDRIHGLQAKYGPSVEVILQKLDEKMQRLDELEHYEQRRQELERELRQKENELEQICGQLSQVRRSASRELTERIRQALLDLNFLDVKFTMEFTQLDHFTALGRDQVQFMISTNPGQPVRPLGEVASGGELSRIMLAIKTVLADSDQIPTLIFDEIDTGISGRTAQKVSEKLAYIARTHQVICITHLPQIAAMADCHFEIEKSTEGGSTQTRIRQLEREEAVEELARLLGGAQITEAVLQNAREMKELADRTK